VLVAIVGSNSKIVQISNDVETDLATAPSGCAFADVAVSSTGKIWASGTCAAGTSGHVYVVGSTLTDLAGPAPTSPQFLLAEGPDTVVASGTSVVEYVAGQATTLRGVPTHQLALLDGQLIALDALNPSTGATALLQLDRATMTWSPIRTPGTAWSSFSVDGGQLVLGTLSQMSRLWLAPPVPPGIQQ
jgi:hypothetical protein